MPLNFFRTIDFSGGVDELREPNAIAENAALELYDCLIDRIGQLRGRAGVASYGGAGTEPGGLVLFDPPSGDRRLVGIWGGRVYTSSINAEWVPLAAGASLVAGPHGGQVGRDALAHWRLYLHSTAPSTDPSFWHSALLAVDPVDGSWTQIGRVRPGCAVFWQGRLWAAGFCQTDLPADALAWSTIFDGNDWAGVAAQNVQVDPAAAGRITALVPARGGEPLMYIFKERSLHLMTVAWNQDGWIPGGANDLDTTTAQIQTLSYRVGCVAPRSAIWTPAAEGSDVFFLAADGVRSLRRTQEDVAAGGVGLPLTHQLPGLVDRINWAWAHRAAATVLRNYFYLALPLDGETRNSHVLVKNLQASPYEGWSVWRLGAADIVGAHAPAPRLFIQGVGVTSDTLLGGGSATAAAHVFELDEKTRPRIDPGGSEIAAQIVTRSYDLGEPGVRKQWRWLELSYSADDLGVTLTIHARRDDEPTWWPLAETALVAADQAVTLPAQLPWQFGSERIQTAKFGLEGVHPSHKVAFRLYATGGGAFRLRGIEVVGIPLAKEWT